MTFAFDIDRALNMMVESLLAELGDEVDLVFRYGSLLKGTAHAYSDLDVSYVPAHESTSSAITVLVSERLIDLYPIHWSTLERMAHFRDSRGTILYDSAIVYQRDTAVAERFYDLGREMRGLQLPAARPQMLRLAQEIFQGAAYSVYLLRQEAARDHLLAVMHQAQSILRTLLHCLAVLNQASIDTRKLDEILALPLLPDDLDGSIERIMTTAVPTELMDEIEQLMENTRALLLREQIAAAGPPRALATTFHALYPELKADIQHLILACERRDPFNFSMVSLLHEIMIHSAWATSGISYSDFNSLAEYEIDLDKLGFPSLLPAFAARDYEGLAARARLFDQHLRQYLIENEVPLNDFHTLDDLQRYLEQRSAKIG